MGIRPGEKITVIRKLPFQGNLYVRIGTRRLAVRYNEAIQIPVYV